MFIFNFPNTANVVFDSCDLKHEGGFLVTALNCSCINLYTNNLDLFGVKCTICRHFMSGINVNFGFVAHGRKKFVGLL